MRAVQLAKRSAASEMLPISGLKRACTLPSFSQHPSKLELACANEKRHRLAEARAKRWLDMMWSFAAKVGGTKVGRAAHYISVSTTYK